MTQSKSSRLSEKRISELRDNRSIQDTTTKRRSFFSSFASFGLSQRNNAPVAQPVMQTPPAAEGENNSANQTEGLTCSLCLDDLPEDYLQLSSATDPVKNLPCCNQHIHLQCYEEYRMHGFTHCHLCRQQLVSSSLFENEDPINSFDAVAVAIEDPMTVSSLAELDSQGEYRVVTTVKAPSFGEHTSSTERYGVDLVLVVDVSGSMAGTKIEMVIKSIKYLIQE
ncbi:hypothetical protein HDV06_003861, partial [Boothiomyces sp. JEL0866]